jgi:hypothetical protein
MDKVIRHLCHYSIDINTSKKQILSRDEMRAKAIFMIKNTHNSNNSRLTMADNAAWWEFIKLCMPLNCERAHIHKNIKSDANIGDLDGIERLNINDYFELYCLPRVTAERGIVSVNGIPKIRYANRAGYYKNQGIFVIAHSDKRFYVWKRVQLEKCQNGRCAWCGEKISMNGSHVDHVQPLVFFGKNEPWNMVVTCEECNKAKSSEVNGWNEFGDKLVRNKKPSWIKKNKCDFLMRKVMADAEKKYDEDEEKDNLRTMTFVAHETTTQF